MDTQTPAAAVRVIKARHNGLKRHRGPDDPATIAAREQLAAAVAERRIREIVDAAPPLSDAQRARLAVLLLGQAA